MSAPEIYFFDMDHTLQNNDSDVSWKQFLIHIGVAPADAIQKVDFFFDEYQKGRLLPQEFIQFQLTEFIGKTPAEMQPLIERHFQEYSRPHIYPAGQKLVADLKATGKPRVLLTSTNRFVAAPFARELGFDDLVATELELVDGRFTGRFVGEYCAEKGKIAWAGDYCRKRGLTLRQAAYYGDSLADRFILEAVGFPYAVNPAPQLRELACQNGWPIFDFQSI